MSKLGWAALCAASVLATAGEAGATVMVATVTGTVVQSARGPSFVYPGDLFGPPDTNITGEAFRADFTFDTTRGTPTSTPTRNIVEGGIATADYFSLSPIISATLQINGHAISYVDGFYGLLDFNPGSQYINIFSETDYNGLHFEGGLGITIHGSALPLNFDAPFAVPASDVSGTYYYNDGQNYERGSLVPTSFSLNPLAVPEPSTWALMIVGAGMIGRSVRQRQGNINRQI